MVDKICLDGQMISPDAFGEEKWQKLQELRRQSYVYQRIHVRDCCAPFLGRHMEIINSAMYTIYNTDFSISENRIASDIEVLLKANGLRNRGNSVLMMTFPGGNYIIEHDRQLLYDGFVVWHTRPMLRILPCDCPFMSYPTSMSKAIADYAAGNPEQITVIENGRGILTNIDDEPLFLVKGNTAAVTPAENGGAVTVMRELILAACEAAGMEIIEHPLTRKMLAEADEAFTASPQGIVSIKGWDNVRYFNIAAAKICTSLQKLIG